MIKDEIKLINDKEEQICIYYMKVIPTSVKT